MNNTYLAHHGILGQKWGVRRFQNKDGSLTKQGKTRYEKSEDQKEYEELAKKPLSAMTNAELARYNNRANLEMNYKNLNKQNISAGKAFVTAVAIGATTALATKLVGNGMEYLAKQGFTAAGTALGKATGKFGTSAVTTVANALFKNKK